jgi:hypothetical protein
VHNPGKQDKIGKVMKIAFLDRQTSGEWGSVTAAGRHTRRKSNRGMKDTPERAETHLTG